MELQTVFKASETPGHSNSLVIEIDSSVVRIVESDGNSIHAVHIGSRNKLPEILDTFEPTKIKSAKVVLWSEHTTYIPEELWDEKQKEAFAKSTFTGGDTLIFKSHKVGATDMRVVFGVEIPTQLELIKWYSGIEFVSGSATMANWVMSQKPVSILCHIRPKTTTVVIRNGSTIKLLNDYNTSNNDEVIYYTGYACKEMNQPFDNLFVSGDVSDQLVSSFEKYFETVTIQQTFDIKELDPSYNVALNPTLYADN